MFNLGKKGKNDIQSIDALELITENESNKDFVIIDVRSPEEYSENHIKNALNINYSQNFEQEIEKLDKNKKYLIYCRSGHRSSNATKIMIKSGFKDIHNLSGGIRKWKSYGLSLV